MARRKRLAVKAGHRQQATGNVGARRALRGTAAEPSSCSGHGSRGCCISSSCRLAAYVAGRERAGIKASTGGAGDQSGGWPWDGGRGGDERRLSVSGSIDDMTRLGYPHPWDGHVFLFD